MRPPVRYKWKIKCVASRPVIGWRLCPGNSTEITDGCGTGQLLCFRCQTLIAYITNDDRPNNYIISAKPARSEATWRLVCTGNKSPQLHGFSVLFCSWLRVCYRSSIQHTTRYLIYSININTVWTCLYHRNSQLCRRPCLPAVIENSAIAFPHSPVPSAVHKAIPPYSDPSIRHRDATVFFSHQISC